MAEASCQSQPKTSRRWLLPRFSLRTLLIFISIVGILLATWVLPSIRQYRVTKYIDSLGNGSYWTFLGEKFEFETHSEQVIKENSKRHWYDHLFSRVKGVKLFSSEKVKLKDLRIQWVDLPYLEYLRIDDATELELKEMFALTELSSNKRLLSLEIFNAVIPSSEIVRVAELKSLESLNLDMIYDYSADDLKPLANLNRLKELSVWFHTFNPPKQINIEPIGELTSLESLSLYFPSIKYSPSAVHLKKLLKLKSLTYGFEIRRDDMVHLGELKSLEFLSIYGHELTDEGLVHLKKLTNLNEVMLLHSKIRGDGLAHLSDLPNLRDLSLHGSKEVSNSAVEHLLKLRRLEHLSVSDTAISKEDCLRLKSLPSLKKFDSNYHDLSP